MVEVYKEGENRYTVNWKSQWRSEVSRKLSEERRMKPKTWRRAYKKDTSKQMNSRKPFMKETILLAKKNLWKRLFFLHNREAMGLCIVFHLYRFVSRLAHWLPTLAIGVISPWIKTLCAQASKACALQTHDRAWVSFNLIAYSMELFFMDSSPAHYSKTYACLVSFIIKGDRIR